MTGIERLREFVAGISPFTVVCGVTSTAYDGESTEEVGVLLRDFLADIADRIEREHTEDREYTAWVREHGGRDEVRTELDNLRGAIKETCARLGVEHTGDLTADAQGIWRAIDRLKSLLGDSVPRAAYARHLARRQRQIDECHEALRRRNQRIAILESEINRAHSENRMEFLRRAGNYTAFADEVCKRLAPQLRYVEGCTKDVMDAALDALDRRLMPEGVEWPTVDGRKVDFKTQYQPSLGVLEAVSIYSNGACEVMSHDGIIKPVSEIHVVVPASDGEPLEVGQMVWHVSNGIKLTVIGLINQGERQVVKLRLSDDGSFTALNPDQLTHQRPDTWQRIEEDAGCTATKYNERRGTIFTTKQQVARDLVRRCRALAERERSE